MSHKAQIPRRAGGGIWAAKPQGKQGVWGAARPRNGGFFQNWRGGEPLHHWNDSLAHRFQL